VRILFEQGGILVAVGEARHRFRRFDARDSVLLGALAEDCGWTESVQTAEQVHGTRILERGDAGCGDAFLIGSGEAAAIRHADCFPVVVLDPARSRAVVAHCGWRGAAGHLAALAVERLLAEGSARSDLHAVVGPGIGPASFEVGDEAAGAFPAAFHSRSSRGTRAVDLAAFLCAELCASGVLPSRIRVDRRDTMTTPELHSFRRDGAHAGRMACLCIVRRFGMIAS